MTSEIHSSEFWYAQPTTTIIEKLRQKNKILNHDTSTTTVREKLRKKNKILNHDTSTTTIREKLRKKNKIVIQINRNGIQITRNI